VSKKTLWYAAKQLFREVFMVHYKSTQVWLTFMFVLLASCGDQSKKNTPTPKTKGNAVLEKTDKPTTVATKPATTAASMPSTMPSTTPTVKAFTASEQGFLVGSYAVIDNDEVLLIDVGLVKPEVEKMIAWVKPLGTVKTIYITHPHPDHYMGLEWVVAAFPEAKVVAAPETVAVIKESGEGTLQFMKGPDYFGGALKDSLASKVIVPEPTTGDVLKVGKAELQIKHFSDAEAKTTHPLYEPVTGSLFSGDLVYNRVHLWLKDTPPKKWIEALEELKKLNVKMVYPGHGEPGGPELLDATLKYLHAFEEAVASSKTQKELKDKILVQFPDARSPAILDIAAPVYFKE
jgi:glyoxylase-like metal-dependent hydrolase (beta-lactamase superfamily II)